MLKKRIAAALIVQNDIVVQSIGFTKYLPVGMPRIAVEFLNSWGIDEILLLDISATRNGSCIAPELVKDVAKKCQVPLTAGGGITNLEQVDELIHNGADKVSVNHAVLKNPELITQIAKKYGDQAIIAAADVVLSTENEYFLYDYLTSGLTGKKLEEWTREAEDLGAGEILLNAVNRDGKYSGFDIQMINIATSLVNIPVIAMGGAGHPGHFQELFMHTEAAAGCAGNFFHFTEHSVITAKSSLIKDGMKIRLDTHANYADNELDQSYRLKKKPDEDLENMLFEKIEKEII